jgi:manganese/iron transport system permease protein
MLDFLVNPWSESFFLRAIVAVLLTSVTCACLGSYVVLRRMAFVSTALTHSILPGVVLASLLGLSPYLGAMVAALITALGAAWLAARPETSEDSAIGIMLSVMFAAGIALMQVAHAWRDFSSLLFGSVVGVGLSDLQVIAVTTLIVVIVLILLHKELELASCDEAYADLLGLRPNLLRTILLVLIALSAVACVRLVGALLTTAIFVIPSAAGLYLGRSLKGVMLWSIVVALLGGITGLYLSYYISNLPTGASIVLCTSVPYLAVRLWARRVR